MTTIKYTTFPRTESPPSFVERVVGAFRTHEGSISTEQLKKGLTSNVVLQTIASDLQLLGFQVEAGKRAVEKIRRPVLFGENGVPRLTYEIDAYHAEWKCVLEVEAGRAWMGNAVYRDLVQACVMVDVEHLVLAVPLRYKFETGGRATSSQDYANTIEVADALYGHARVQLPYKLVVVGY